MQRRCVLCILIVAGVFGWNRDLAADEPQTVRCAGKVVDAGGLAVAGAAVTMFEMVSDGVAGNFTLEKTGELVTAADGAFAFDTPAKPARGTPFIEGYVVASKDGLAVGWAIWGMREDLTATIILGALAAAEGVIVDEAGQPVADAHVLANLLRTRRTAAGEEEKEWLPGLALPGRLETRTDRQGRFAFGGLPEDVAVAYLISATGKATIYMQDSDQPPVLPGQTGVRFVLPGEGRIAGRILDPGTNQGVARTQFAVVPASSGLMYYRRACTTDPNGAFVVGGLQAGKYLVRGKGLPGTYVEVRSGTTADVTIHVNQVWYGRILFHDGTPAVVKPAPWPGASTRVLLADKGTAMGQEVGPLDDEGYFHAYLSADQVQKLQSEQAWFHVLIPLRPDPSSAGHSWMQETAFARGLLSRDRAGAGVMKIVRPAREAPSLVNTALPALDPLGLGALQTQARNRSVLLCFLDVQQRPSRSCLQQLTAQAQELQAKGIAVAGVQALNMDRDELDKWLRENDVRFPVGVIPADEERTRSAWGVKSLPWMILTDQDHKVLAEGFGVDKLDEMMGRNAAKQ